MYVIPAIDILDGKVVRLRQGRYDEVTVYGDDPVAVVSVPLALQTLALEVARLDDERASANDVAGHLKDHLKDHHKDHHKDLDNHLTVTPMAGLSCVNILNAQGDMKSFRDYLIAATVANAVLDGSDALMLSGLSRTADRSWHRNCTL